MLMQLLAALTFNMPGRQATLQARAWLAALYLVLTPSLIHAYEQIHSFSEVAHILQTLDPDDLVVFDVDDVLIEQEDALLQSQNNIVLNSLLQQYLTLLDDDAQERLISTLYLEAKRRLIEPNVRVLIYSLQEKKIPTIALTATRIGGLGNVASIQDWRMSDLARWGIAFDQSFSQFPHFVLEEIQSPNPSPVFKAGILFSAFYSKGKVLRAFLEKVSFRPKTVVFFDDRIENVLSVLYEMQNMGIKNVYSFHYMGHNPETLDPVIVECQVTHLMQHGHWLSDAVCKRKGVELLSENAE